MAPLQLTKVGDPLTLGRPEIQVTLIGLGALVPTCGPSDSLEKALGVFSSMLTLK